MPSEIETMMDDAMDVPPAAPTPTTAALPLAAPVKFHPPLLLTEAEFLDLIAPTMNCWNCDADFEGHDMQHVYPDIPHLSERMGPGDEVPAGECPRCGMLVHPGGSH